MEPSLTRLYQLLGPSNTASTASTAFTVRVTPVPAPEIPYISYTEAPTPERQSRSSAKFCCQLGVLQIPAAFRVHTGTRQLLIATPPSAPVSPAICNPWFGEAVVVGFIFRDRLFARFLAVGTLVLGRPRLPYLAAREIFNHPVSSQISSECEFCVFSRFLFTQRPVIISSPPFADVPPL